MAGCHRPPSTVFLHEAISLIFVCCLIPEIIKDYDHENRRQEKKIPEQHNILAEKKKNPASEESDCDS